MLALSAYAVISIVTFILYGVRSLEKTKKNGKLLAGAFFVSAFLYLSLLLATLSTKRFTMEIGYSIGFTCLDWVLYLMFLYVTEMCEVKKNRTLEIVLIFLLVIDNMVFFTNPFTGLAAEYEEYDFYGVTLLKPMMGPFYVYHALLLYFLLTLITARLYVKTFLTSRYYRMRYGMVATAFTLVILSTFLNSIGSGLTDLSLFAVMCAMCFLYHCQYSFSPRTLMRRLMRYINDHMADATIVFDESGDFLMANEPIFDLIEEKERENIETLKAFTKDPTEEKESHCRIRGRWYSVKYEPVVDKKEHALATAFIFHDITESEERFEREHRIAITDPLTGAYNRKGFFEAANEFLYQNESEAGFALIVSGIVNFKGFNSRYGSGNGDTVLKTIERKFHDYHHEYPMLYGRTAEGKFAVLIPFDYVEELTADMSCNRITIGRDAEVHVDMCHGFIILDDVSKPLDYYYERALIALAECKSRANLNSLEYSLDMEEKVVRKQELLAQMHDAINEDQFFLELQPQIRLESREIVGAEALVRWKHPKLGRISPGEFIPLFEDNGFIVNLDVHIWNMAAKLVKEFHEEGSYQGPVSINVSQVDITNMDVAGVLDKIVKGNGITPEDLHVEITESACAGRREALIATMERLHEKGFLLEIDDFGSGYSSLNALMHLPFDVVKLDMEFMKENDLEGKNGIIMNSVVNMIHALGAEIIVEGVETEINVDNMVRFGGDIAQGYYFSRPLPVERFREYVKSFR